MAHRITMQKNRMQKMTYKISFHIKTDADPTTLLDLIERQAVEFVDSLDAEYDIVSTLVDGSPCVETCPRSWANKPKNQG